MKVILEGDERIVKTICRENRVRVSRGQVSFSPADSIPTPEGVTEEDVKNMVEAIELRDARIDELMNENEILKATLAEKEDTKDAPETPDTKGDGESEETGGEGDNTDTKEGEETDTTQAPEGDTKDAPEGDTKDVEEAPYTKGKKSSKK
jgi:uncharacterized small protein (DUF1192 family)